MSSNRELSLRRSDVYQSIDNYTTEFKAMVPCCCYEKIIAETDFLSRLKVSLVLVGSNLCRVSLIGRHDHELDRVWKFFCFLFLASQNAKCGM